MGSDTATQEVKRLMIGCDLWTKAAALTQIKPEMPSLKAELNVRAHVGGSMDRWLHAPRQTDRRPCSGCNCANQGLIASQKLKLDKATRENNVIFHEVIPSTVPAVPRALLVKPAPPTTETTQQPLFAKVRADDVCTSASSDVVRPPWPSRGRSRCPRGSSYPRPFTHTAAQHTQRSALNQSTCFVAARFPLAAGAADDQEDCRGLPAADGRSCRRAGAPCRPGHRHHERVRLMSPSPSAPIPCAVALTRVGLAHAIRRAGRWWP